MCKISPVLVAIVSEDLFVRTYGACGLEIELSISGKEGCVLACFDKGLVDVASEAEHDEEVRVESVNDVWNVRVFVCVCCRRVGWVDLTVVLADDGPDV